MPTARAQSIGEAGHLGRGAYRSNLRLYHVSLRVGLSTIPDPVACTNTNEQEYFDSHGSTGAECIPILGAFVIELAVVYHLRPGDRYKSRAVGTTLIATLLLCGGLAANAQQTLLLEWVGLNLALVVSAVAHTLATPSHVTVSRGTLSEENEWLEVDEKHDAA